MPDHVETGPCWCEQSIDDLIARAERAEAQLAAARIVIAKAAEVTPFTIQPDGQPSWFRTVTDVDGHPAIVMIAFTPVEVAEIHAATGQQT